MRLSRFAPLVMLLFVLAFMCVVPATQALAEPKVTGEESGDATGTDPRDFSSKFMPYYYYTELENDLKVTQFNLFGMYAFTPKFAFTYDLPVAKEIDYGSVDEFKALSSGNVPPIGGQPGLGGGLPFDDLEDDGDVIGIGDLNLRFFVASDDWKWTFMDGKKSMSVFPVLETTLPTASKDVLGGNAWILSPGITFVTDMPFKSPPLGLGFLALMNFFDFDVIKDDSQESTTRFRGRWFWMQPLSMPASMKNPKDTDYHFFDLSGLYLLTEFQPVYDFMESEFSFWIGPEFGKIIKDGQILYVKPGFGIDNDEPGDREFSLEIGFRYFM